MARPARRAPSVGPAARGNVPELTDLPDCGKAGVNGARARRACRVGPGDTEALVLGPAGAYRSLG
jgi:hypothetical protein